MVTHALGSCLGITAHDGVARVGGMLHAMLPVATINPEKAKDNPSMFVDTGVPILLRQMLAAGAAKDRLVIKVAGAAARPTEDTDHFCIGKRNYFVLRKILWQHGLMVDSEDVGGDSARTMYLEVGSGRVWLNSAGREKEM